MISLFPESALSQVLLVVGTVMIGLSKTGIPGLGILFVAIFATVFPSLLSTGVVLPLLICADLVAVYTYHGKTVWKHLFRLIPPAICGVVFGYFWMRHLSDEGASFWIGFLILAMVMLHFVRKRFPDWRPHQGAVAWFFGVTGGIVTMVANAAGPLVSLYLLEMKLKKEEFMGTGAWFYLLLNSFKVPFGVSLGIIHFETIKLNLVLLPCIVLGAILGRKLNRKISDVWFERVSLSFASLAAIRLLIKG